MSSTVAVTTVGVPIAVEAHGLTDEQLAAFTHAWAGCDARLHERGASREFAATVRIRLGQRRPGDDVASDDLRMLADLTTSAVTVRAIDANRARMLLLHAAAVSDPATGATVALIGPSGRGKTTAATALGRVFGYVTDETAGIGDDLGVVPYRKPLSVKVAGERFKSQISPTDLGLLHPGRHPLRLAGLVLLDRRDDAPLEPSVTTVSLADAVSELVPQISHLAARDAPLHRLRDVIDAVGGLVRVTYREAAHLAPVIGGLLAREAESHPGEGAAARGFAGAAAVRGAGTPARPGPEQPPHKRTDPEPTLHDGAAPERGLVRRRDVDDWIDDGDRVIVLRANRVRVLDGIAPELWRSLPAAEHELVVRVVAAHGEPQRGDAAAMVTRALAALAEAGLVGGGPVDAARGTAPRSTPGRLPG